MRLKKHVILISTLIVFLISTIGWADSGRVQLKSATPTAKPNITKKTVPVKQLKSNVVVETFAHMPAPLEKGNNINIFINFKNKGVVKSKKNDKYKISCMVLSGGGPDSTCPIPTYEKEFGKEILPGKTHSEALFGATPAEAGKYKVSISVLGQNSRPYSVILTVPSDLQIQKAPEHNLE